ncbi:putative e3 ubiquitin-protein ligase hectd1 [Paratrimastix pyriformis]|uniref:E3 ubiquitin-protein ligase hectd1 n=1 Tax=Paratrimastix pyriformis TaxID=342808 RepID=A0ABQ8UCP6_9EUKA|nr:putative e3 ubiquitin-protein ligase hectd1 [Paratrimastix pyriformis]
MEGVNGLTLGKTSPRSTGSGTPPPEPATRTSSGEMTDRRSATVGMVQSQLGPGAVQEGGDARAEEHRQEASLELDGLVAAQLGIIGQRLTADMGACLTQAMSAAISRQLANSEAKLARLAQTQHDLTQTVTRLTQELAQTKADLTQTQRELAESRAAQSDTAAALSQTKAELAQTKEELAQTHHSLGQTQAELAQTTAAFPQTQAQLTQQLAKAALVQSETAAALGKTQHDLAQAVAQLTQAMTQRSDAEAQRTQTETKTVAEAQLTRATEQTHHELGAIRTQIDQLFNPPAAPEGLTARWDEATQEVALNWLAVPDRSVGGLAPASCALAAAAPPPVHYRVQATLLAGHGAGSTITTSNPVDVYTGPECHCRYRFPVDRAEARFVVVAMRGLAESGPSAPATCTRPVVFLYDHDMDERGLFFYIGSQGRIQPWQNPALAGWVIATRSSECGKGSASDIMGRVACESSTANQPNSWWQVDLGAERLFAPTRYTLRHGNFTDCRERDRLQSWRLEGFVGGADGSWRTLDEHTEERYAISSYGVVMTATFAVAPERAFPARRFRVLMTGPNTKGSHFLQLAGLEMYGSLSHSAAH